MLNFAFSEEELGIISPPHFVHDFSIKIFFMLYSILTKFHCVMFLLREILGNMCIAIAYFPACDVINFEIKLVFLIKPFFYMTKKSRQNLNVMRMK